MLNDWIFALIGGATIGLGGAVMLLGNGRIAGISGILGQLVDLKMQSDWAERALFGLGLFAAPLLYMLFTDLPEIGVTKDAGLIIASGLLVGFGARMGSGCTSGHGVCGNSRLSRRSITATITFVGAGMLTVTLMNAFAGGL